MIFEALQSIQVKISLNELQNRQISGIQPRYMPIKLPKLVPHSEQARVNGSAV